MTTPRQTKIIGVIAHCDDCNFIAEDYKNAQREASKHHKQTGHTVSVEITRWRQIK